jgi:hypothetical protein
MQGKSLILTKLLMSSARTPSLVVLKVKCPYQVLFGADRNLVRIFGCVRVRLLFMNIRKNTSEKVPKA